jgi:glyoxylase I family protein
VKLHHVNIVTDDMPALDHFYQNVLGIPKMPSPPLIAIDGYSEISGGAVSNPASFLDAGDPNQLQIHLCRRDVNLGARYGHPVNPVLHGHVAFRCDDIEEVKNRLESHGVQYSDYGEWAVKGWYQIFFYDPVGTVVEVHQVL